MTEFKFDGAGLFDYVCPVINTAHTVDDSGVEQYVIDNNQSLYDFTGRWFDEIKVFLKNKKELVIT
jgi:hypothetical protein